jgi:hypothetical protein
MHDNQCGIQRLEKLRLTLVWSSAGVSLEREVAELLKILCLLKMSFLGAGVSQAGPTSGIVVAICGDEVGKLGKVSLYNGHCG